MSTTFVDIFKGYNFVVDTKTNFEEEAGQKARIRDPEAKNEESAEKCPKVEIEVDMPISTCGSTFS